MGHARKLHNFDISSVLNFNLQLTSFFFMAINYMARAAHTRKFVKVERVKTGGTNEKRKIEISQKSK